MTIREKGTVYQVTNRAGTKVLGTHKTRAGALKQLRAIEASKHAKGK